MKIFAENLLVIEKLNESNNGAHYGVTKFADLTQEEFREKYLTLKNKPHLFLPRLHVDISKSNAVPSSYDWREQGLVTGVKDQGQCGSCWAFGTIAAIEGQYVQAGNHLTSFSEQELVDCDTKQDQGCNGGLQEDAFDYLKTTGTVLESAYPYKGTDNKCKLNSKSKYYAYVYSWYQISTDEEVIKQTCYEQGPITVGINADWFQFYTKGVFNPIFCPGSESNLNHAVTIVGYGNENNTDYWLVKNSWGVSWGEEGYIKVKRGASVCGINTDALSVTLKK